MNIDTYFQRQQNHSRDGNNDNMFPCAVDLVQEDCSTFSILDIENKVLLSLIIAYI